MTGEMRNSSSRCRGVNFQAKDRLFMDMNLVCAANVIPLRLNVAHALIFPLFLLVSGKKVNTDQFLNRLPKMVVKGGRVLDIRDSVRDTLLVRSSSFTFSALVLNVGSLQYDGDLTRASHRVRLTLRAAALWSS